MELQRQAIFMGHIRETGGEEPDGKDLKRRRSSAETGHPKRVASLRGSEGARTCERPRRPSLQSGVTVLYGHISLEECWGWGVMTDWEISRRDSSPHEAVTVWYRLQQITFQQTLLLCRQKLLRRCDTQPYLFYSLDRFIPFH